MISGYARVLMKCLSHLCPDAEQGSLDKQLYRVDRKYSLTEKKLQEQKEKERQNKVKRDAEV